MNSGVIDLVLFFLAAIPPALIDLRERRIPDVLLVFGLLLALWRTSGQEAPRLLGDLLAGGLGFAVFWCVWYFSRGKMGLADAKFASVVGAFSGVAGLCAAVFVAASLGLLFALALIAIDPRNARARIPFAPFLSAGGAAAMAARLARWPAFLFGGAA